MYIARRNTDGTYSQVVANDIGTYGSDFITNFSYNKRLNGGESISFTAVKEDSTVPLIVGNLYTAFLDKALTKPLPSSFIIQAKRLIQGDERIAELYEYDCIGAEDLFERRWVNVKYRNIKFKTLIERLIDYTREKVPYLSNDYSLIADVDYTFAFFETQNEYLSSIFQKIREIGFSIYLTHDLKVFADKSTDLTPLIDVDFQKSTLNSKICLLTDGSAMSGDYRPSPTTSLVVKGGYSQEGDSYNLNVISNTEPIYDLEYDVSFEENFKFESFDTTTPEEFTKSDLPGLGWDKRYLIYDVPLSANNGLQTDIKIELVSSTGECYIIGLGTGNSLLDTVQAIAFKIENQALYIINNRTKYSTGINLKSFEQKTVTAVNGQFITLDSVANLNVGDKVSISGLNSTISAVNTEILSIAGNTIKISDIPTGGNLDNVLLERVEQYEFRWIYDANQVKYYFKRGNGDFELIGTYGNALARNSFIIPFNCYTEGTITIDDGIWEIGNLAVDWFFCDKSQLIQMRDAADRKVVLCTADQFQNVDAEAVVNRISKNEINYAQIEFISPSIVRTIFKASTASRLQLVLTDDDFLKVGMRVLVNDFATEIVDFFKDEENGYIDVSPSLPSVPAVRDEVYINTSIPVSDSSFRVSYIPTRQIVVRECADDTCIEQFGFRERLVEIEEIQSISDCADRALELITEECNIVPSGSFGFKVSPFGVTPTSFVLEWFELPTIGSYIQVSDSLQSISNEIAQIQSISIDQTAEEYPYVNVAYEFGFDKIAVNQALTNLIRRFGIFKINSGSEDISLQVPCIMRESIEIEDSDFSYEEYDGFDFLSGLYYSNYSGMYVFGEDVSFDITETDGEDFLSGLYYSNYSGMSA